MGVHSTLFGPVKYAYLPQHLKDEELTGGNGLVEMGTFVAILAGTMAAGFLVNDGAGADRGRRRLPRGRRAGPRGRGVRTPVARAGSGARDQLEPVHGDLAQPRDRLAATRRSSTRCWASRGSGSSARSSSPPSRRSRRTCSAATRTWSRCCSRVFSIGHRPGRARLRAALRPQGRDRAGAVRLDRHDGLRRRPVAREPRACALGHEGRRRVRARGRLDPHHGRPLPAGALRRASTPCRCTRSSRAAPSPSHRARIIAANNILNALFMIVASLMATALLQRGAHAAAALPRGRPDERRRGRLHLPAGARVPDAVPVLAARPLGLPPAQGGHREHPRGGRGASSSATT